MRPIYIIFQGVPHTFNQALIKLLDALKADGLDHVKASYQYTIKGEFEFLFKDLEVKEHILINQALSHLINENSLRVISWSA